jgi:hypothetical protein
MRRLHPYAAYKLAASVEAEEAKRERASAVWDGVVAAVSAVVCALTAALYAASDLHPRFLLWLVGLYAVAPGMWGWRSLWRWGRRMRANRRRSHGLCPSCGYDLRGNSGDRCSECGRRFRRKGR